MNTIICLTETPVWHQGYIKHHLRNPGINITGTVTRKVTLDTGAPVFEKVTLTPNPVDCGKTFVISVKVTD